MGMPGIGDFQRFHGFVDEIREIEFIDLQARRTGFHAGQIKQKRDQIRQTVRLVENAFQIRWGRFHNAVGHVLDHGLQRGYRRTQLVAHIGYHVPSHLVGMLQFLRHLIERQSQLSDFVAAVGIDMHPDGVVAVRHSLRGIPHLAQGRGESSRGDAQSHGKCDRHGYPQAQSDFEQEPSHDECDDGGNGDQHAQFHFERREQTNRAFGIQRIDRTPWF